MRARTCYRVWRVIVAALWIVLVGSLPLFAQSAGDNPGMSVTRTLSAAYALPGSTFQVTLEVKADADVQGVGFREQLPIGWLIRPMDNAGASVKRSEGEWSFGETIDAGTTQYITYEVTVPSAGKLMTDPLPQCFTISGTYQTTVPRFEATTNGESTIEIVSALPIGTAIAHLVPGQIAGSGIINLRLSRWISEAQLLRALELWQRDLPVPGTAGERIDLAMMNHLAAQFETCTRADDVLPLSIDPELNVVRTLETFLPCDSVLLSEGCLDPGQAARLITVKVEITPAFDAYGVSLKEWIPSAWRATPIEHDGFWYRPSASEWVHPTRVRAGESIEVIYQIEVMTTPFDRVAAGAGCCGQAMTLVGEASSALECSVAPVLGEDKVTIDTCLSVMLAISRWDVAEDQLDAKLPDTITFPQVQRAIQFWIQNLPVPHTCGYTVGYHTLKNIVAYWLSGTPITMPLSEDGPLAACGDSTEECETSVCIDGWICQLAETQDPIDFVGLPEPLTVVVNGASNRVLTCVQPTIMLSAMTTGGVPPIRYEWKNSQAQTVGTELTLFVDTPGTYTLIARSCGGCLAIDSVTVSEDVAQPIVEVSVSNVLTGSDTTAEVIASVSGGAGPFTSVWTLPSGELVSDLWTLSVCEPGIYAILVTGANGCSGRATENVLQDIDPPSVQIDLRPVLLVNAAPPDAVLTCSLPDIVLEGRVSGGREPYVLQWEDGQGAICGDMATLNVDEPGTYTLTATGANGVSASASVDVDQDIERPVVAISSSGELTCAVSDVTLSTTVNGGRSPFTYQWTTLGGDVVGTDKVLIVTEPGTYAVRVTGLNGCSSSASIAVEQHVNPPVVVPTVDGVLTCSVTEVAIAATASGGREPYSFTWVSAAGSVLGDQARLPVSTPGAYTVVVVGDNGCSTEATVTVVQDIEPPVVTASVDGVLNCDVHSVKLHANVVGGRTPLTFEWTSNESGILGTDVSLVTSKPGTYTVLVTGANGCMSSDRVVVEMDTQAPAISISAADILTCAITEVQLTSNVSGGRPPYTYEWIADDGLMVGQSSVLTVSTPGMYSLTVAGANGCQSTETITVQQDTALPAITIPEPEELSCVVKAVAVTADVVGGREPYSYVWTNASTERIGQQREIIVSTPGIYSVEVTGANGCQSTASIRVHQDMEPPSVAISVPEVLTCALTEIILTADVAGGSPPYAYEWTDEAGQLLGVAEQIAVASPGLYSVTVTGSNGCASSASVTVCQDTKVPSIVLLVPETLTCSVSAVTLTSCVSGGRMPYVYQWADEGGAVLGDEVQLLVEEPGTYTLTVTGSNGCASSASVTVQQDVAPPSIVLLVPETLTCSISAVTLASCVSGGRMPYVYQWADEGGAVLGDEVQLLVEEPGTYTLTVTGSNGCASSASVVVQQDAFPPCISLFEERILTCAEPTVSVAADICGGCEPFTYQWTNDCGAVMATTEDVVLDMAGTYTLIVTVANGCSASSSIEIIDGINPPTVDAGPDQVLACAGDEALLNAAVMGGTRPYTYSWVDSCGEIVGTCEDLAVTVPGTYILTVRSADGCVGVDSVTVESAQAE